MGITFKDVMGLSRLGIHSSLVVRREFIDKRSHFDRTGMYTRRALVERWFIDKLRVIVEAFTLVQNDHNGSVGHYTCRIDHSVFGRCVADRNHWIEIGS